MSKAIDLIRSIFEIGFGRKEVESKISNLASPINLHLIKILKWEDTTNYEKHIDDIDEWVTRIPLNANFKLKEDDVFKWLCSEYLRSDEYFNLLVSARLRKYSKLRSIRSNSEVFDLVQSILRQVVKDYLNCKFVTIKDYLPT